MKNIHHYELQGRTLAYSWSHHPTSQPLVVLHGLGDSAIHSYGRKFPDTALRDIPALFIDLPGFGEASADYSYPASIEMLADDVAGLLDFLEVRNAPFFAHSMGANVALLVASGHAHLASQILLAEPLLDPAHSVLATGIAKQSEQSFVSRGYRMLVRATSLQMHRGDVAATAFHPTLRMADPVIMHRTATSLIQSRQPSFADMLLSLNMPLALLMGEQTDVDTTWLMEHDIRIVHVPHRGHFMMAEDSASLTYAILGLVL